MRPIRNLALTLTALLVIGIASVAIPIRQAAAVSAKGDYEGSTRDTSSVQIYLSSAGTTATVVFTLRGGALSCPREIRFTDLPLTGDSGEFNEFRAQAQPISDRSGSILGSASVSGYVESLAAASASGAFEFVPAAGQSCPARRSVWRAGSVLSSSSATRFGPQIVGVGSTSAVSTGQPAGTVRLSVAEGGRGLASFSFSHKEGNCQYDGTAAGPLQYDAGSSLESNQGSWTFTLSAGVVSASGGIWADGTGACPSIALYYTVVQGSPPPDAAPTPTTAVTPVVAAVPTVTPIPTSTPAGGAAPSPNATPAPTSLGAGAQLAGFVAPPLFGSSGMASAVFLGGSVDQLEATALAAKAGGVWAQDSSGAFQLLVVGGPAFLRDTFKARIPNGFNSATAVTLTR